MSVSRMSSCDVEGVANIRGLVFLSSVSQTWVPFISSYAARESKRMSLFCSSDTEIVSSLCKTMEEQDQFTSEENVPFAEHQLLKEDLKKAIVNASDISE